MDTPPVLDPTHVPPPTAPSAHRALLPAQVPALPVKRKPKMEFEIGVIYRKNSRLFIAVEPGCLITFKNGKLVKIRPLTGYDPVRFVSVEDLCSKWGITLDQLDEVTARFLAPPTDGLKTRPRGDSPRRQRAKEEALWRELRTIRIAPHQ